MGKTVMIWGAALFVLVTILGASGCAADSAASGTSARPAAAPTAIPDTPAVLEQLNVLWGRSDWPAVISLLQAQEEAGRLDDDLKEKLYAALVNAGQDELTAGQASTARARFQRAATLMPSRPEAQDGLQEAALALATPTPKPSTAITVPPTTTTAPPKSGTAPSVEFSTVTSPVSRGSRAKVTVQTTPAARCSITVTYESGPITAAGLTPDTADAAGAVSWTWLVGSTTTPGDWPITVTCSSAGATQTASTTFTVTTAR